MTSLFIDLLCIECDLPLNKHTNYQLKSCRDLYRQKEKLKRIGEIIQNNRNLTINQLTKHNKDR